jgi:hypothetical protein
MYGPQGKNVYNAVEVAKDRRVCRRGQRDAGGLSGEGVGGRREWGELEVKDCESGLLCRERCRRGYESQ